MECNDYSDVLTQLMHQYTETITKLAMFSINVKLKVCKINVKVSHITENYIKYFKHSKTSVTSSELQIAVKLRGSSNKF